MAKITAQQVAALKARDKPYKRNVDTGLQIRVATSGVKTWVIQYMIGGRQRELRLARTYGATSNEGQISLADARIEAAKVRAMARDGVDVQVQRKKLRAATERDEADRLAAEQAQREIAGRDALTVNDMFDVWIADGVRRKDGNAELRRQYDADIGPKIGAIPVKDVTEHDLRAVLRALVDRGVNRTAVIARNNLTQMFAWARKRQPWRKLLVEGDPMELIEIEKIVAPEFDMEGQRDRVLSASEIVELRDTLARQQADYDAAPNKRVVPQPIERRTQLSIWIMLSTLCRVGEMSMARWEHVDLATGEWLLPKANVKDNVGDLQVYLSPFALDQFRQLHALTGQTDWCFPNRDATGHIDVKSISKQIGDRQWVFKKNADGTPRAPLKNRRADNTLVLASGANGAWTPHDLRRTGATIMQKLGVSLDTIDRCQNHVLPGSKVRRHYMHHDYADEKRSAWKALSDHLTQILKSSQQVLGAQDE